MHEWRTVRNLWRTLMLGGWRKLEKEEPKTDHPTGYVEGQRVNLSKVNNTWYVSLARVKNGMKIPANFFRNLLFMDNLRDKK